MTDDTISAASLQAELDRFSYKPGWTFTALPSDRGPFASGDTMMIRIRARVEDSRPGHQWEYLNVESRGMLPYYLSRDELPHYLLDCIRRMEDHETREWFRHDGSLVDNPHAKDAR